MNYTLLHLLHLQRSLGLLKLEALMGLTWEHFMRLCISFFFSFFFSFQTCKLGDAQRVLENAALESILGLKFVHM